jgi:hypothetical protein
MDARGTKCRKRSTTSSSAVIDADGLRLLGAAFALFWGSRVITQACFDQISFHSKWVDYRRRFLLSFTELHCTRRRHSRRRSPAHCHS